jgi:hypothetical protein
VATYIVCTFHEPFTTTGNGYFANVIGLVCAVGFAAQQFPELKKVAKETTS